MKRNRTKWSSGRWRKLLLILSISLLTTNIWSQNVDAINDLSFSPYKWFEDDGLEASDYFISALEDTSGILWVATNRGLFRCNARNVTNFSELIKIEDTSYVQGTNITALFIDASQRIWIGSNFGLGVFDQAENKYTSFNLNVPNGDKHANWISRLIPIGPYLYVLTRKGVHKIGLSNKQTVARYLLEGKAIDDPRYSSTTATAVYEIDPKTLYIQTHTGMYELNGQGEIERKHVTNLFDRNGQFLYQGVIINQEIVMPSYGQGMVHFDLNSKTYKSYKRHSTEENPAYYNRTKSLLVYNDSLLIINAEYEGVGTYDLNRHTLNYQNPVTGRYILPYTHFLLTNDADGHIWVGDIHSLNRSEYPVLIVDNRPNVGIDVEQIFVDRHLAKKYPAINGDSIGVTHLAKKIHIDVNWTGVNRCEDCEIHYKIGEDDWNLVRRNGSITLDVTQWNGGIHTLKLKLINKGETLDQFNLFFKQKFVFQKSGLLISLLSGLLLSGLILGLLYRRRQNKKMEVTKINYDRTVVELELFALRSQMNPHFIFNTLNSIRHHVLFNTSEETDAFIQEFAKLIRTILDKSKKKSITLEEELEFLKTYIAIESRRFQNDFNVAWEIDPLLNMSEHYLPPMILQPLVENAIWHGLMPLDDTKRLKLRFQKLVNGIAVNIIDNGIGIKRSQSKKATNKSVGLDNVKERLEKWNKILPGQLTLNFEEANKGHECPGTIATIVYHQKEKE